MIDFSFSQIAKLAATALPNYKAALQASDVNATLAKYGINNSPLRLSHFLAQVFTECGALTITNEYMNYSASRLVAVWPKRFPTLAAAQPFAHNQPALAERVYGGRMGNVNKGDGYKYRGRGLLQITGHDAYRTYGQKLGIPLESEPDLAFSSDACLAIAAAEWAASGYRGKRCNDWADEDNIENVTYAVNGGQTGIDDRRAWLKRMKVVWTNASASKGLASRATANLIAQEDASDDDDIGLV